MGIGGGTGERPGKKVVCASGTTATPGATWRRRAVAWWLVKTMDRSDGCQGRAVPHPVRNGNQQLRLQCS